MAHSQILAALQWDHLCPGWKTAQVHTQRLGQPRATASLPLAAYCVSVLRTSGDLRDQKGWDSESYSKAMDY